jgi:hypothetical protein
MESALNRDGGNLDPFLGVLIVWWRKPYGGLDGHGTSSMGRCEGSPESSEVSSPGKLSVFSQSPIGTLGKSSITVMGMLLSNIGNLHIPKFFNTIDTLAMESVWLLSMSCQDKIS